VKITFEDHQILKAMEIITTILQQLGIVGTLTIGAGKN
jgi:hypothetical protein